MTMATKFANEGTSEKAADAAEGKAVNEAEQETDEGVEDEIEKILNKNRQILIFLFKNILRTHFFISYPPPSSVP